MFGTKLGQIGPKTTVGHQQIIQLLTIKFFSQFKATKIRMSNQQIVKSPIYWHWLDISVLDVINVINYIEGLKIIFNLTSPHFIDDDDK